MSITTLYRFYDADDVLLYVGISERGPERWKAHRKGKPWWTDVARTTTEHYDTRQQALDAERAAIIAEKPLHNVVHNSGSGSAPTGREEAEPFGVVKVGDVVAIRTHSHDYPPVGMVRAVDRYGIRLSLMSFATGYFNAGDVVVMWDDVISMLFAEVEDKAGSMVFYDTRPLGAFQDKYNKRLTEVT